MSNNDLEAGLDDKDLQGTPTPETKEEPKVEEPKEEKVEAKMDEKVVLTPAQFEKLQETQQTLLDEIEKLKASGLSDTRATEEIKKNKNRIVKVRSLEGNLVSRYGKTWDKKDKGGEIHLMVEIFTEDEKGEETKHEVDFTQFMEFGEVQDAEIIDIKKKNITFSMGKVSATVLSANEWDMVETGEMIDCVAKIPDWRYVVKLEGGEEKTLHHSILN